MDLAVSIDYMPYADGRDAHARVRCSRVPTCLPCYGLAPGRQ